MRVILPFLVNTLANFAIGLLVAKFLGPEEFGRFALALAIGVVIQTAIFDWLRLAAVRFYSERKRVEQPELRATLDVAFALITVAVSATTVFLIATGLTFSLAKALLVIAASLSVANGLFDYQTALVRARFHDQLYGRLILTKNLLALFVTAGGAFIFRSAEVALTGVCVSMVGSILLARTALNDEHATPARASRDLALEQMRYALPIVAANFAYTLIPLVNRALTAHWYGYSETGQFSLAFDIGTRVIAAIGTALDVLLFQIAVRADETHGEAEGREQVARNMAFVFAILLPTCAGVWLTLPSIEALIVPAEFRGPFERYFSYLLPAFFAFGMINFAINPVFQIAKRTGPLIVAACIAGLANAALISLLPRSALNLAIAQSGGMLAGLAALIVIAGLSGARWPRMKDLAASTIAVGVMIVALTPLRAMPPGLVTLVIEVVCGLAIYGAFIALFDIAGLRGVATDAIRTLRARFA